MAQKNSKFMDVLGLSDASDSDSSGSDEETEPQPVKKAKQNEIDLEKLQEHGYKGGLSVLLVPEKPEGQEANWNW